MDTVNNVIGIGGSISTIKSTITYSSTPLFGDNVKALDQWGKKHIKPSNKEDVMWSVKANPTDRVLLNGMDIPAWLAADMYVARKGM